MMTALNGRAVLFGGVEAGGDRFDGDTWEWDGASWTLRQAAVTPPASYYGCLGQMVTLGGKALLVGRRRRTDRRDLGVRRRLDQARARGQPARARLPRDDGDWEQGGAVRRERWPARPRSSATPGSGTAPTGRRRRRSTRRARSRPAGWPRWATKAFCSAASATDRSIDTWEWDGVNWMKRTPAHFPAARGEAAMTSLGGKVVLFGGYNGGSALDGDLWQWDGTDWTQIPFRRRGRRAAVRRRWRRRKDRWSCTAVRTTSSCGRRTPGAGMERSGPTSARRARRSTGSR